MRYEFKNGGAITIAPITIFGAAVVVGYGVSYTIKAVKNVINKINNKEEKEGEVVYEN